ncbi:MAG: D-alanyl-D-alanine carboxypeptidase [Clostridiales bacterium]|nr:D-alanyl-D-alanine carboxypeptidase [Clostridiales bacterium]
MKKIFKVFVSVALLLVAMLTVTISNQTVYADTAYSARAALLMDYDTGEVLFSQNEADRLQIASMVKIMTLNLIFDEIDAGNLSIEDEISVSENASGMGGSQAFLDAGCNYKADELIKSIIVASANDSCVAMAEHIAGSVSGFVARMNDKAERLGMANTNFVNCTGLPAPNQYCCASDVATMFRELVGHKQFFDYSKIWMFDLVHPSGRITQLSNTNKLIRFYEGCDGGKTGFTTEALSCLAATARRGDTRLISVIIGAPDSKTRNKEVSAMLNEGFANYETRQYVFSQNSAGWANVNGGKEKTVECTPAEDYFVLTRKGEKRDVNIDFYYFTAAAPVRQGDVVGKATVTIDGEVIKEIDLIAKSGVEGREFKDILDEVIKAW